MPEAICATYELAHGGRIWHCEQPTLTRATKAERTSRQLAAAHAAQRREVVKAEVSAATELWPTSARFASVEERLADQDRKRLEYRAHWRRYYARLIWKLRRRLSIVPDEAVPALQAEWYSRWAGRDLTYFANFLWEKGYRFPSPNLLEQ